MKLVLGCCTYSILLLFGCNNQSNSIHPELKPIVESVYANASIKAAEQYTVYPAMFGKILDFNITEGSPIVAGQIIAHLDHASASLSAETATEARALSKSNSNQIQEIEALLATAKNQAEMDSLNYQRQQNLWNKQIGSLTQLESRRLAMTASKNNVKSLQVKLSITKKQLSFNQIQAQNNNGIAQNNLKDFDVKSDIGGQVFQLLAEKGEWVSPQKPIAIIGNSHDFFIQLEVDEVDIAKIAINQLVFISLDAYKNESFKGHVSHITPIMNAKTQSFEVMAVFDELPKKLYPGLSAEANIVINKKEEALLIPVACLNNNAVRTKNGDVKVKVGLRNLEFVEILEGLNPQSDILMPKNK